MEPLDRFALGRQLTLIANAGPAELADLPAPDAPANSARRIGLTGPPGAGKSTLAGLLAVERAAKGRIGVIAIDPSSPNTGGAILGDRIRMDDLPDAAEVYIRSVASRSMSDGLADNLPEMLDLMDEFGFREVILETVGVGQVEYAARIQVDTLVLVLHPDSGDMVQAIKAGIAEMADIFVVNKADLPGAKRTANDIVRVASFRHTVALEWKPPVLLATSDDPDSIRAISEAVDAHQQWLDSSGRKGMRLRKRSRYRLQQRLMRRITEIVATHDDAFFDKPLIDQMDQTLEMLWNSSR